MKRKPVFRIDTHVANKKYTCDITKNIINIGEKYQRVPIKNLGGLVVKETCSYEEIEEAVYEIFENSESKFRESIY
jgi:hypothetical protein